MPTQVISNDALFPRKQINTCYQTKANNNVLLFTVLNFRGGHENFVGTESLSLQKTFEMYSITNYDQTSHMQ